MSIDTIIPIAGAAVFCAVMIYAAAGDLLTMRIPDTISVALVCAFFPFAILAGWSSLEILMSVTTALVIFFVSIGLFALGWLGGGDGKLAIASTLWVGSMNTLSYFSYVAIAGGIFAALLLIIRHMNLPARWMRVPWIARLHDRTTGVPYAVAFCAGALVVLPQTPWFAPLA